MYLSHHRRFSAPRGSRPKFQLHGNNYYDHDSGAVVATSFWDKPLGLGTLRVLAKLKLLAPCFLVDWVERKTTTLI